MKTLISVIFTFFLTAVYGQTDNYKTLLDRAKTLFKAENNEKSDYYQTASILEKVIKANPKNAEARYFLGYTYSRINSYDGQTMLDMDLELLYKTSEQFEKVIELSPKYTGEIVILDPYSKLTAEWGSMAMSYWYKNKIDSAVWAFGEGKKRGGFSDFILGLNRRALDDCSKNAILISSGDNFSMPLWYLQIVENYRTDVSLVEISLLESTWYPAFLSGNKIVAFDIPNEELDSLEYIEWYDNIVTINDFSWTVKPAYYEHFFTRGEILFLSLLKENRFRREVFFTTGFMENKRLCLKEFLSPFVVVDKLSVPDKTVLSFDDYKKNISQLLSLSKLLNLNSSDEYNMFDGFIRYNLLNKVRACLIKGENERAKELMNLLDKLADDKKFPFYDKVGKEYADYLRQALIAN